LRGFKITSFSRYGSIQSNNHTFIKPALSSPSFQTIFEEQSNTSQERPLKKRKIGNEENLLSLGARFLENGWKLIDSALLSQPVQKSSLKRGNPLESPVQILLRFIPPAVWNILVTAVNRNLSSNQSSQSKKRYSLKMATVEQLI
jgi:hypothetical protein